MGREKSLAFRTKEKRRIKTADSRILEIMENLYKT
ncbi:MAG: hypothetical protein PWQ31_1484 [Eubacteriales bacterium]|nr:hypothetical protein [Eubacteriales bacterium]